MPFESLISQEHTSLHCHTDDLLGTTFKRPKSGVLAAVEYSRTQFYAHRFFDSRGNSACLSRQFAHFGSLGTVWFVWVAYSSQDDLGFSFVAGHQ